MNAPALDCSGVGLMTRLEHENRILHRKVRTHRLLTAMLVVVVLVALSGLWL